MGKQGREQPKAATDRVFKFGEWVALLSICATDDSPAGVRDAAMIALFKIVGLRRAEIATLNLWHGLQPDETGFVPLSIAEFSL